MDIELSGFTGETRIVPGAAVEQLISRIRGALFLPGTEGYESSRQIHNMIHDYRPGMIIRCAGVGDVIQAVNFARDHGILTSIRGGGHGVAGFASNNGGLQINLSAMQSVRVDPVRRIARAEAGATWGALFHEAQAFGLATTGGVNRPTGIAGLTLGGGHGFLMRSCGLSIDNLLSADVVTANGHLVTASASENADLFWGLRGAGHNFGVTTSLEYKLHAVGPMVYAGLIGWTPSQAPEVMRFYSEYTKTLPDEMGTYAITATFPNGPRVFGVQLCYNGPIEEGARLAQPLKQFAATLPPLIDELRPMPYMEVQSISELVNPQGFRNYWKSMFLRGLDAEVLESLLPFLMNPPHPRCQIVIEQMGGAVSRVPESAMAGGSRNAKFNVLILGIWDDPAFDSRGKEWARDFAKAAKPFAVGNTYVNYVDAEEAAAALQRGAAAWGEEKYARLLALKKQYDPTNLFRLNQNIAPV